MTLFLTSLPVKDVANHSRVSALSMALCLVGTIDVALGENKRENTGKKRWEVEGYFSLRRIVSLLSNPGHNSRPRAWRSTHRSPWPIPFGHDLGRGTHNLGRGRCRRRLLTGHRRRAMSMSCPGPQQTTLARVLLACLDWSMCEIGILLGVAR